MYSNQLVRYWNRDLSITWQLNESNVNCCYTLGALSNCDYQANSTTLAVLRTPLPRDLWFLNHVNPFGSAPNWYAIHCLSMNREWKRAYGEWNELMTVCSQAYMIIIILSWYLPNLSTFTVISGGRVFCINSLSPTATPADPLWEVTVTLTSNSMHTVLSVIISRV